MGTACVCPHCGTRCVICLKPHSPRGTGWGECWQCPKCEWTEGEAKMRRCPKCDKLTLFLIDGDKLYYCTSCGFEEAAESPMKCDECENFKAKAITPITLGRLKVKIVDSPSPGNTRLCFFARGSLEPLATVYPEAVRKFTDKLQKMADKVGDA